MTNKNAYYKSDLGIIKIIYDQNLIGIELTEKVKGENHKSDLSDKIYEQINGYLKGKVKTFDIYDSLQISGTAFQKSVWEELIKIPYGETKTYKEIAQKINKPKAVRAVANAIGKNPFFIIIPCHRVIRNDGTMGGFAYGPDTKEKLLDLENKY
ncbi:methylated-DNA--[protein]-cysteine S-methyltransferase [Anaerococcus urinomassiliensis]|uniref:methylated-DNA--[protein]-cysteine S-methyltransferase n=1 Tax=Anaerococcus urinomassiliensis TaxID=1745712 RepID=UPI00093FBA47|nr:methylated-DNA--[protein]-cysteine S-methyltransferase [Anaerococcus urinomassiliensis]